MANHYAAFVIRHLHRTHDDRRITIEQTRTGEICTVAGVEDAIVWLAAHSTAPFESISDDASLPLVPLPHSR